MKALEKITKLIDNHPEWDAYLQYCLLREKGLKKQALQQIDIFVKEALLWSMEQKIQFLQQVLPVIKNWGFSDANIFPHPLSIYFVKPTLLRWCEADKMNNEPYSWYGVLYNSKEHILKALELNAKDDLANVFMISGIVRVIWFATHHLPDYFIGDPATTLKTAESIHQYLPQLTNTQEKEYWQKEWDYEVTLLQNYIAWQKTSTANFTECGKENNVRVSG